MKKNHVLSIVIVLLFLGLGITPIVDGQTNIISKSVEHSKVLSRNLFNPDDEGDHLPCGYELWCYHAALTLEDGQRWDAAASFFYVMNKTKSGYYEGLSFCRIRHWNRQTGKYYDFLQYDEFPGPFRTEKNEVNLTYYNSSARGLYPNYHFHCEDDKNNIVIDLRCHAISSPYFMFQESTNGVVPWFGKLKAYFVPMLEVIGELIVNDTLYNVTGVAYYEHDFGHIDFSNPFKCHSLKEFLDGMKSIFSFTKWRFSQVIRNRPEKVPSLHRSNDYLLGWVWNWIVFDNGWSMVVLRPTISRISEGVVPAVLYFTKDGQNYTEIGCVYWRNNREKYIEQADIYIPLDFEITAYKDDIALHVIFNSTTEPTEIFSNDVAPFTKKKFCSFYSCGTVRGYYTDKENKVSLKGDYALEQTRLLRKFIRHRSLDVEIDLPSNGFGISIRRVSHRLGLERFFKFHLRPFEFIFYIKPVPDT